MEFIMIIAAIIALIGIPVGVVMKYKIRPSKCASEYLDKKSVNYRQKSDTYIRTTTSKVKLSDK